MVAPVLVVARGDSGSCVSEYMRIIKEVTQEKEMEEWDTLCHEVCINSLCRGLQVGITAGKKSGGGRQKEAKEIRNWVLVEPTR
jgi:hypothetical protein